MFSEEGFSSLLGREFLVMLSQLDKIVQVKAQGYGGVQRLRGPSPAVTRGPCGSGDYFISYLSYEYDKNIIIFILFRIYMIHYFSYHIDLDQGQPKPVPLVNPSKYSSVHKQYFSHLFLGCAQVSLWVGHGRSYGNQILVGHVKSKCLPLFYCSIAHQTIF